jgi:hypothetical protein
MFCEWLQGGRRSTVALLQGNIVLIIRDLKITRQHIGGLLMVLNIEVQNLNINLKGNLSHNDFRASGTTGQYTDDLPVYAFREYDGQSVKGLEDSYKTLEMFFGW